jgi:hypothetical protein
LGSSAEVVDDFDVFGRTRSHHSSRHS